MTQETLNKILEKHSKWLRGSLGGERAELQGADLQWLDLRWAELRGADLQEANLQDADLREADLQWADLRGADLRMANLLRSNLRGANLTGAKTFGTILNLQCSEEGSFIAWKKLEHDSIAKLLIPEDAERSSATSRKCRASKAIVLAIYGRNGEPIDEECSQREGRTIYRVGETVYPDKWDCNRWNECSNGIHFFLTRREAEEY